jgi:hypothetical protein
VPIKYPEILDLKTDDVAFSCGATDGEKIPTVISSLFARGDAGFGGPREGVNGFAAVPPSAPDLTIDIQTYPGQALVYRTVR